MVTLKRKSSLREQGKTRPALTQRSKTPYSAAFADPEPSLQNAEVLLECRTDNTLHGLEPGY